MKVLWSDIFTDKIQLQIKFNTTFIIIIYSLHLQCAFSKQ